MYHLNKVLNQIHLNLWVIWKISIVSNQGFDDNKQKKHNSEVKTFSQWENSQEVDNSKDEGQYGTHCCLSNIFKETFSISSTVN